MKIILDQNIHRDIKEWLKIKKPDWDIYHIADLEVSNESIEDIFSFGMEDRPVIITLEEDFTHIKMLDQLHNGIIRINIWLATIEETQDALTRLFKEVAEDRLYGAMIVIDETGIRVDEL